MAKLNATGNRASQRKSEPEDEYFYSNYGRPMEENFTNKLEEARKLQQNCRDFYGPPARELVIQDQDGKGIRGINVTVYTHGIHRSVMLHLPKDASDETRELFKKIRTKAAAFCQGEHENYKVLSKNCVTSVSSILNYLDPKITPPDMVVPWSLDANIKKHAKTYAENSLEQSFITKYQEIANKEVFSSFKTYHWESNTINSSTDIVSHAYGKAGGTGERTKSTLVELGWVVEDKISHLLWPTDKAPPDFKTGLEAYNNDYEKVQELKQLYNEKVTGFSRNNLFKNDPDYETAIKRIKAQAEINPNGASAAVLKELNDRQISTPSTTDNVTTNFKVSLKQSMSQSKTSEEQKPIEKVELVQEEELRSSSIQPT